jgi:uncharacterized protein
MMRRCLDRVLSGYGLAMLVAVTASNLAGSLAAQAVSDSTAPTQPRRVMIVTGEDYEGHKWQETAPVLQKQLVQDRRLQVEVTEDLGFLRSPDLHGCQAVVMHFKNYDPALPGAEGYQNLVKFVRAGGGLVLVHFACGAFQEFKDFGTLAGRVWDPQLRGHDPHGKFRVEIADQQHPITRGLSGFETTDELYTCLTGDTPITVLAQSRSNVDGKDYPMAFVLNFGQGRVFHCLLGHDVASLEGPEVGRLYRRGCAWAAGLEPR